MVKVCSRPRVDSKATDVWLRILTFELQTKVKSLTGKSGSCMVLSFFFVSTAIVQHGERVIYFSCRNHTLGIIGAESKNGVQHVNRFSQLGGIYETQKEIKLTLKDNKYRQKYQALVVSL